MWEFNFFEVAIGCSLTILLAIYYHNVSRHSYWRQKNVKGPEPIPIFGNFRDTALLRTSLAEMFRDLYQAWKHEPFIGLYRGTAPVLLVNDPTLLKHIFIRDFTSFTDRGILVNEDADPLSAHLFVIGGHRWRGLRTKLSPAFTSGKLRQMYYLLCECADHFEKYVDDLVAKGEPIECKEITAKFTTDVIGSCAFGLNMNALSSEESKFREMGRRVFAQTLADNIRKSVRDIMPGLFRLLQIRIFSPEMTDFFQGSIAETIAYRKKNDVVRHDFIDLLMEIQAQPDKADFELTDSLLAAQAFVFFLAGFETSATTITFALYELAQNPNVQEKLRSEIQDALKAHNGQLPYEEIRGLKYLHKVFQETLRKYPPLPILTRKSVKDYTIPNSNVHIPVDTQIFISVLGLHHNSEFYPNPEVFDPERFETEAIKGRPPMTYLPFGDGPRNCIGARFANYQTKIGIIKVLNNHKVSICSKTQIPYTIDKNSFTLSAVGGIYLEFTKIVSNCV